MKHALLSLVLTLWTPTCRQQQLMFPLSCTRCNDVHTHPPTHTHTHTHTTAIRLSAPTTPDCSGRKRDETYLHLVMEFMPETIRSVALQAHGPPGSLPYPPAPPRKASFCVRTVPQAATAVSDRPRTGLPVPGAPRVPSSCRSRRDVNFPLVRRR